MCGSATLTMVASSTTMSWAVAITTRARPRLRWRAPPPPAWAPLSRTAVPAAEAPGPLSGVRADMTLLRNFFSLRPSRNKRGRGGAPRGPSRDHARRMCLRMSGSRLAAAVSPVLPRYGGGSLQVPVHLLGGCHRAGGARCRGRGSGGLGRGHLADQGQQDFPFLAVQHPAPRHDRGQLALDTVTQPVSLVGEDDVLHPAVARMGLTPGQAALFQAVRDHRDERRVAVQPTAELLHGHRAVQGVQGLEEEGRERVALRERLPVRQDLPDQLANRAEDFLVKLVGLRFAAHLASFPGPVAAHDGGIIYLVDLLVTQPYEREIELVKLLSVRALSHRAASGPAAKG